MNSIKESKLVAVITGPGGFLRSTAPGPLQEPVVDHTGHLGQR